MYIIMCGDNPKVLVKTEADAQELIMDLNLEFATENFNWMMRVCTYNIPRAMKNVITDLFWYKKVEEI